MFEDHLKDGAKVLDIGSGSGYLTACFAVMAGPNAKVIGIDHIQELVDWSEKNIRKNNSTLIDSGRIKLVVGDGHFGFEEEGPYHVIHVGAADSGIPQSVRFYDSKSDIIDPNYNFFFFQTFKACGSTSSRWSFDYSCHESYKWWTKFRINR